MYKVFRTRKKFQYLGWVYAPRGRCGCEPANCHYTKTEDGQEIFGSCTTESATACQCSDNQYCKTPGMGACGIKPWQYGGDIFVVREGDPHIDTFLYQNRIASDASLPTFEELVEKNKNYQILVDQEPIEGDVLFPARELVPA